VKDVNENNKYQPTTTPNIDTTISYQYYEGSLQVKGERARMK
jgi:hypothetical protein